MTSEDTIRELHIDEMAEREMRKKEVAMTTCPSCGRAVSVQDSRVYQCSCGRGTLKPLPDFKIQWLPEDEANLTLVFAGNRSRFGLRGVLVREATK